MSPTTLRLGRRGGLTADALTRASEIARNGDRVLLLVSDAETAHEAADRLAVRPGYLRALPDDGAGLKVEIGTGEVRIVTMSAAIRLGGKLEGLRT